MKDEENKFYWSSTIYADGIDPVLGVQKQEAFTMNNYGTGGYSNAITTDFNLLRLVRGSAITSSFTDNGDGTTSNSTAGLMWKTCSEGYGDAMCSKKGTTLYNYDNAKALAAKANEEQYAGYNDWRLPTIQTLSSLVLRDNQSPPNFVPSNFNDEYNQVDNSDIVYWSSSKVVADNLESGEVWLIQFVNYSLTSSKITNNRYVRLVRDGRDIASTTSATQ